MKKIILFSLFSCISMISSVVGQCDYPTYEKYGLVCDEARFLCGYEMDGFTGRLLADKSPLPQPDPLCEGAGEADNIQWFSFITDDVNVEIVIKYSNCTGNILSPGLQVGIFESCELNADFSPLGSVYCIEDINYSDIVLSSLDLEVGQLYLLFVDGYAGSACDFEIDVIRGICTETPAPMEECEQDCGVIYSNVAHESCTLFQDTYLFNPAIQLNGGSPACGGNPENTKLDSIICVEWVIQPDVGYTIISESFEYYDSLGVVPTLVVEWLVEGDYLIKPIIHFNPLYSTCGSGCICTDEVAFSIHVTESSVVTLPEVELCPGECVDFCGQMYCEPGIIKCYKKEDCLVEVLSIVEKPSIVVDEGLFYLCPGECFEFQGVNYCDPLEYSVVDTAFCDKIYLFQLENLAFTVDLISYDDILNCEISEAFLAGNWNTNFIGNVNSAWISESGDTVAYGTDYTALDGGIYTFVAWPEGMQDCAISLNHSVIKDDAIPTATLFPPFLDCYNDFDFINISSPDNIISAEWNGPNGFVSNDINAEVNEMGSYEVVITTSNGCTLVLKTDVEGDFEMPDVDVEYENWSCNEEIPSSHFSTISSIDSHQWTLPDGSISMVDVLTLNSLGNYVLEVTAANGCQNITNFDVVDLSYDPSLHLNEDRIWRCTDTEIILDLTSQKVQGLDYIWTNLEGAVVSNSINLTMDSPGIYVLTIEDKVLGCVGQDTVRIKEDPNPFVDIELETFSPICQEGIDGSIGIISIDGGEGPYSFEINGETFSDFSEIELAAGSYTLNIIDAFDCRVVKNIEIPEADKFSLFIDPEVAIRFGQNTTLTFDTDLDDSEIASIEWTNDEGEVLGIGRELYFVGKQIENLYIRIENLDGCEAIAEVKINLSFEVDIYYPNVFSPNNDGNNDMFNLYNNGFPEMADDLKIFDRSGEMIYKSTQTQFNDSRIGWDGNFNGDQCQPGVYVFLLEYTLMNGDRKTLSGSITLVR